MVAACDHTSKVAYRFSLSLSLFFFFDLSICTNSVPCHYFVLHIVACRLLSIRFVSPSLDSRAGWPGRTL